MNNEKLARANHLQRSMHDAEVALVRLKRSPEQLSVGVSGYVICERDHPDVFVLLANALEKSLEAKLSAEKLEFAEI